LEGTYLQQEDIFRNENQPILFSIRVSIIKWNLGKKNYDLMSKSRLAKICQTEDGHQVD
jgi:hypothetical protein